MSDAPPSDAEVGDALEWGSSESAESADDVEQDVNSPDSDGANGPDEQDTDEPTPEVGTDVTIEDVRDVVLSEFDERIWNATEAVLSVKATLLLSRVQSCAGVVIVGPSGSGKTTVLRFFEDAEHDGEALTYRSDDMTHAAFVSHDSSKEEEELAEGDLLPNIRKRLLLNPDMAGWYTGSYETIRKRMAYLAIAMDGRGLVRNTGAHGRRGYQGDYRFALAGATTPLSGRAWDAMGTVGNRLVFHVLPGVHDINKIADDVFDGTEYGEKVVRCQAVVSDFLGNIWEEHGGYGSVHWLESPTEGPRGDIAYLANLIRHSRAPIVNDSPHFESPHRVVTSLHDIARGHSLLNDRDRVTSEDIEVCARVALSTMHKERRGVIQAILDPGLSNPITSTEIANHPATEATKNTIRNRMDVVESLGIGDVTEDSTGRNTKQVMLYNDFEWPIGMPYPELGPG